MADFTEAHRKTMGNEGGYAFNPNDAGGETYKGIARKFHGQWRGWTAIDRIKDKLVKMPPYGSGGYRGWVKVLNRLNRTAELDNALQSAVLDFYKREFWDVNRIGEIVSQDVAEWVYDHVVNGGARGAKWIQEAAGVVPDGAIGTKTLAAINAAEPAELLEKAKQIAGAYRLKRIKDDPTQRQFAHSWLSRDGYTEDEIKSLLA